MGAMRYALAPRRLVLRPWLVLHLLLEEEKVPSARRRAARQARLHHVSSSVVLQMAARAFDGDVLLGVLCSN